MPRAAAFREYGPPTVLGLVDIPEPSPQEGQVVVAVKAAGVQPFDAGFRRGDFAQRTPAQFPQILGNEFAGVVHAVGKGVTAFKPGDAVIGFTQNAAYTERVVVPATHLVAKPRAMSWHEAGVISASGQTAYCSLQQLGLKAGETLLVHAAAGGVGSMAVQIAHVWGANVIGTASARNHDYLRSLGATPVAYGEGLVDRVRALAPEGVDVVLDCVGGEAIAVSATLGVPVSRIGTTTDFMAAMRKAATWVSTERSAKNLGEVLKLWENGQLRLSIWKAFPLERAAEAHAEIETGHVRGKIVLTMD